MSTPSDEWLPPEVEAALARLPRPTSTSGCSIGDTRCGGQESHPYLSDSDKLAADYTMLVRLQSYKWRLLGVPKGPISNSPSEPQSESGIAEGTAPQGPSAGPIADHPKGNQTR